MKFYFSWSSVLFTFICVILLFSIFFIKITHLGVKREYRLFEVKKKELQVMKEVIEKEILVKKEYIQKMNEPSLVIKVSKQKMGYVEPGEIIIRFE